MIQSLRCMLSVFLVIGGLFIPLSLSAEPTFVNAGHPNLPEVARGVPQGGALRIADFDLDGFGFTELELERFAVFAPDAEINVNDNSTIAPPANAYFRGRAAGLPDTVVVLTVPEHGAMRGLITDNSGTWLLAGNSGHGAHGLSNRKLGHDELSELPPFACGTESIAFDVEELTGDFSAGTAPATVSLPSNVTHTARIAVETDYEYFAMFGNEADALAYMGDLFAYASAVYEREVNTNLLISWSRLWTNGAASDPWEAQANTSTALDEFLGYWNTNMGSVDRTLAHMLSGKSLGGGIAYVGVLCNNTYGYGLSASLGGNFDINNPSVIWDIVVVSHEIGHNFSSRHTQDYCGIESVNDPVDLCYSSANGCGSALGLPGIGSLSGGTTSERPGTIMSYCHLVGGGMSNLSFTFGQNHLYGVAADRVPARMYDHVLNRAAIYPNCLALSGSTQNAPPSAGYTFSTSDLTATFTDTSSDSDGSIVGWSWHFGDGATSLTQSPAHTYVAAGDYQVTLEVTDNDGATDSMVQSISVSEAGPQPPTAPTDLVAAVNQFGRGRNKVISSITLNWTDSSNNENAFIIEGCKEARTGKGKNKSVSCDYVEVGNSGANVTNFSVDLSNDHDHFRVKAVNEAGSSDYSNEVKT